MENNDKEFFSDIELTENAPQHTPPISEAHNIETNDFESEDTQSELNIPVVPEKIEYTNFSDNGKNSGKKGLKVFCIILALIVLISGSCLGGYFAGRNSVRYGSSTDIDLQLEVKPTDTDEYTASQVYSVINKSIVGIVVYNAQGDSTSASGVVYSEDGYIITNDHIYSEITSPKFRIYTYDGKEYTAKYIAGDTRSDLAVLKIDSNGFYPATFGNSNETVIGESVVAVGRPSTAQLESSITTGSVSLTNRRVSITTSYSTKFIQTDAAINPGSSGGALVNMYGQVIGITSSKVVSSEYDRVGFAIPTTTVKTVVESLIKNGYVINRAKLGISYTAIDSVTAEINNLSSTGIYVAEVDSQSNLYGKVSKGDIITQINGTEITNDNIVLDIIESSKPGDVLEFTVITSSGQRKVVSAALLADKGSSSYATQSENTPLIPETPSSDNDEGRVY